MSAPPPPPFTTFPQYQGGSSFSVFSAQGSNPAGNCKIFGKSVQKVYDKSVKGYVYSCSGGMGSKIQFPRDDKTGLQLVQPYLVLQLFVPKSQHFSLELRATDTQSTRRKMYFSTSFSELKANPLHCQIPLSMIMRNTWISLALDVPDLFHSCFRVLNFRSLDVIIIGPVCKLRKIFTMRNRLAQSVLEAKDTEESLPAEHAFAAGVETAIQVIDLQKIQNLVGTAANSEGRSDTGSHLVLAAHKKHQSKRNKHVNVAFGSRTPLPLSMVCIETNLPHDGNNLPGGMDQLAPRQSPNKTQTRTWVADTKLQDIKLPDSSKVTESGLCPLAQTRMASFAIEKQLQTKSSSPINNIGPVPVWDKASFPVQEELHVDDDLEPDPVVLGTCSELTSKHGQKLQKMMRKREVKLRRRYPLVRHSQKENLAHQRAREMKEFDIAQSPPRSPPCGWDNNSNEGSDSFLFEQHFDRKVSDDDVHNENLVRDQCTNVLPGHDSNVSSCGDSNNKQDESFHVSFQSGCALTGGDSYFEKKLSGLVKGCFAPTFQNGSEAWLPIAKASNVLKAKDHKDSPDFQDSLSSCSRVVRGETSQLLEEPSIDEATSLSEHVCGAKKVPESVGTLEHSGPFGSTEELWVVHEEVDSTPAPCNPGADEKVAQIEWNSVAKLGHQEVSLGPPLEEPIRSLSPVADARREHSSIKPTNEESFSNKFSRGGLCMPPSSNIAPIINQTKLIDLNMSKAWPSKLEDKELDLLYDPILGCYYDPKTNRYYELK